LGKIGQKFELQIKGKRDKKWMKKKGKIKAWARQALSHCLHIVFSGPKKMTVAQ